MSDSVWPHRRQPTRLPHPWDFPGKNTGVGCHFLFQLMQTHLRILQRNIVAADAKLSQLCPTLCDPIDGSPPGSPIPGIFQARTLEYVAISFSNVWKEKWKWSLSVVSNSSWLHGLQPTRLLRPWNVSGKNTEVGCHRLLWNQFYYEAILGITWSDLIIKK